MRSQLISATLYGILDLGYVTTHDAIPMARQMLVGGVGILQLRAKSESQDTILNLAKSLAPICRDSGVPLILNDYPELVAESRADGVHVGQDDLRVAEVRRIVGPDALIGLSTHSPAQALAASPQASADEAARPDYIGFGPLFPTPTKPDYFAIGLDHVGEVSRRAGLPVFCIGGIKLENLPAVVAAGARRAVIVSGILQAPDPAAYCAKCLEILRSVPADAIR